MRGWHFCTTDDAGRWVTVRGDPPLAVVPGESLAHDGPAEMCKSGLHCCAELMHSLAYARGDIITHIEADGVIAEHNGLSVVRRRRCLWGVDGTELLYEFARLCALDVIGAWEPPAIVLDYLKTGSPQAWREARLLLSHTPVGDDAERAARGPVEHRNGHDAAWVASVHACRVADLAEEHERRLTTMVVAAREET